VGHNRCPDADDLARVLDTNNPLILRRFVS
jgi:hypothetical protein